MKKIFRTSQFALFALFIFTWLVFGIINPSILSIANIYSLTRACIIPSIFSLSLMLIMIQGGIDMSFAAIGSFSSYCSIYIFTQRGMMQTPLIAIFLVAALIAVALELVNWFFIDKLSLQPFITTLAMQTMLKGAILAFISTSFIYTLPDKLRALSTNYLHTASFSDGTESVLHVSILVVVALYVIMHLVLKYTTFGRNIYAIGGDETAARRAGIKVSRVRLYSFIIAGLICAMGGLIHDCLARSTVPMPSDIVGQELTNIAAVVLGTGTSKQARGSVVGTLLGVVFLRFVATNLIMLGVPSYWQEAVSGVIIFVGLIVQMSNNRAKRPA